MAKIRSEIVPPPPTIADRRSALETMLSKASSTPELAELVCRLPDEALAVESAPLLVGRLRTAGALLTKADSAWSAMEAATWRSEATRVLTAPPAPPKPALSAAQTAERERLLTKADATTDPTLARGYRLRADQLGKEIHQ